MVELVKSLVLLAQTNDLWIIDAVLTFKSLYKISYSSNLNCKSFICLRVLIWMDLGHHAGRKNCVGVFMGHMEDLDALLTIYVKLVCVCYVRVWCV